MRLLPLRRLLRSQAIAYGFPDPIELLDNAGRFGEPSEVAFPVELLRAGAVMHARGLINSSVLQYNLDWKWPYWITRQFNPQDVSFIPRAFSLTHINMSHRNWVAVGLPGMAAYPVVDPAGLLTPYTDSWSLEVWICDADGNWHTSADASSIDQCLDLGSGLAVITTLEFPGLVARLQIDATAGDEEPACRLQCSVEQGCHSAIAVAVRPANPEGISFVHTVARTGDGAGLAVDGTPLSFGAKPDFCFFSDYRQGDVFHQLDGHLPAAQGRSCPHGMATAVAVFQHAATASDVVTCRLPLTRPGEHSGHNTLQDWHEALAGSCRFRIPERRFQYLTDAALRTLVLLSPGDVYPGSFTYKRFWFRDAAYMVSALIAAGLTARARRALNNFLHRQQRSGYFHSQQGEWDSNGQVLWIFGQYFDVTGLLPDKDVLRKLIRGGEWIAEKRKPGDTRHAHPGLLPPGFSAEHLGPNDFYYWDDLWSVAGLRALARLCRDSGMAREHQRFAAEAEDLQACINQSLARVAERLGRAAMPAAPGRRLDAAVIGSLVASYPLQLYSPQDARLQDSLAFLKDNCLLQGAFYQEMIHSGINAYLTLHMAQAALRAGDSDYFQLVSRIAELATGTGQWPEAIHPRTGGGCMGDGQHGWAAAEWLLMMRNMFIREEGDQVILASGIPSSWLEPDAALSCERSPVGGGLVSLELLPGESSVELRWNSTWHRSPRPLRLALPGFPEQLLDTPDGSISLKRGSTCAS